MLILILVIILIFNLNIGFFRPEWMWIVLGIICSCAMGALMPIFSILFGDILGVIAYTDTDKARYDMQTILSFKKLYLINRCICTSIIKASITACGSIALNDFRLKGHFLQIYIILVLGPNLCTTR